MKVVIDIPDEDYKFIKDLQFYYSGRRNGKTIEKNVINGIRNGKPYAERQQGEWIIDEDAFSKDFRKCSNCNEDAEWLEGGCQFLPNYCPNCGADMRKEAENE